jgi:hypothetical protein
MLIGFQGEESDNWRAETINSVKARLDASKASQSRSRLTLGIMGVISMMMIIACYNAYFSFDYKWALDEAKKKADDQSRRQVLVEQDLRSWADSRRVSVALLGIKVSVDDAPILGTVTLSILSVWLMFSIRREHRTIGSLLFDTDSDPPTSTSEQPDPQSRAAGAIESRRRQAQKIRWLIYHTIDANSLLTNVDHSFASIKSLQRSNPTNRSIAGKIAAGIDWCIFQEVNAFFFLFPVFSSIFMFIGDCRSYYSPSPYQLNDGIPTMNANDGTSKVVFTLFFLPLSVCCLRALLYSRNTEQILREYWQKIAAEMALMQSTGYQTAIASEIVDPAPQELASAPASLIVQISPTAVGIDQTRPPDPCPEEKLSLTPLDASTAPAAT